jgi:cell pole-organizing protein PopZ
MSDSSLPKGSGGAAGAPGDPQMDDILASIRRILNEDEAAGAGPGLPPPPPATAPPAAAAASAPGGPEPLQLTEAMLVQPPPAPAPAAAAPPPPPPAPPSGPPPSPPLAASPAEPLVAPAVVAATTAAVGQLLRTVAQERAAQVSRGGPTIEDVVREEIRPILKDWLDAHLPPLVERLVRAEIERVVGRALP